MSDLRPMERRIEPHAFSPTKSQRIRLAALGARLSIFMAEREIDAAVAATHAGLSADRAYAVVTGQANVTIDELSALAAAIGSRIELSVQVVDGAAAIASLPVFEQSAA